MSAVQHATVRFIRWNRGRKLDRVRRLVSERNVDSILLVGVSSSLLPYDNMIERGLCECGVLVIASGLSPPTTDWPHYVVCDGLALPFGACSFDLVFSNAVVEHVGDADAQLRFISEHERVGKNWVITTPNRWFPVEAHTRKPLRHWLRSWRVRQSSFTRLLSRREFTELLPAGSRTHGRLWSPTLLAVSHSRAGSSARRSPAPTAATDGRGHI